METQPQQFMVFEKPRGVFQWVLFANNQRVAVSGEAYRSHADCLESIRTLIAVASTTGINDKVDGRWHKHP